ncbi:MAG: hypothetical protein ACOC1I_01940, partial [Spirochaetota bacterium]
MSDRTDKNVDTTPDVETSSDVVQMDDSQTPGSRPAEGDATTDRQILASREGIAEKAESMWSIYIRRFRKHTLGKIGLGLLLFLYLVALFADFLAPFDMTWTNKEKPYHPPTRISFIYNGPDGAEFKPFVYERRQVNVAFREYGVIPERSMRIITVPPSAARPQARVSTSAQTPVERKQALIDFAVNHYRISRDSEAIARLSAEIDRVERDPDPDARALFRIGALNQQGLEQPLELIIAKGNKNFVGLFTRGTPYRFLGLFQS